MKKRELSETMICPVTGQTLKRGVRPVTFSYKGHSVTVDQPGYYPAADGESIHVGKDLEPASRALRDLKRQVDGIPSADEIKKLRQQLRLSQRDASELLRVGTNAFAKYETERAAPSGPTAVLLRLLMRRPELVEDIRSEQPDAEVQMHQSKSKPKSVRSVAKRLVRRRSGRRAAA